MNIAQFSVAATADKCKSAARAHFKWIFKPNRIFFFFHSMSVNFTKLRKQNNTLNLRKYLLGVKRKEPLWINRKKNRLKIITRDSFYAPGRLLDLTVQIPNKQKVNVIRIAKEWRIRITKHIFPMAFFFGLEEEHEMCHIKHGFKGSINWICVDV